MDTQTTLSVSEARKKIFTIIDEVEKLGARYTLTEKGRPKAVIMSADEFESWVETFEVMREFPDLKKDIKEVEEDIKSGKIYSYPTLEEVIAERKGFTVADKKKRYGLSNKTKAKGKKTAK